jgi:ATP phosphoribosyltransferase
MANEKVKLAVEISKEGHDRLVALQKKMESPTLTPVLASSLQLMEEMVRLSEEGFTFKKIDINGIETALEVF